MNFREYIVDRYRKDYSTDVIELVLETRNGKCIIVPTFVNDKDNFLYKLKGRDVQLSSMYESYITSRVYELTSNRDMDPNIHIELMKLAMQDFSDMIKSRRIL